MCTDITKGNGVDNNGFTSRCKGTVVKKMASVTDADVAVLVHPGHLTEVGGSGMSTILHGERVVPRWLLWKQG